jgi:hypothetical protein
VPTFRNIGPDVYAEKRVDNGGALVATGESFEIPGETVQELDDGYLVGKGDDARVWPKSQWELVKATGKSTSVKEN